MAQTKTAAKTTAKKTAAKKVTPKKAAKKKAAPRKAAKSAKAAPAKRGSKSKDSGEQPVTVDRRREERRDEEPATGATTAAEPKLERREKVNRRRQIDPTTCERDYSEAEVEFMNALDDYKRRSGRMFPTCSEVLEVIRDIGYVQLSPAEQSQIRQQRGDTDEAAPSLEQNAEADAIDALDESDELRVD